MHVQYGWSLQHLCEWGGWSDKNDAHVILRYLTGHFDDPIMSRHDMLNPLHKRRKFFPSMFISNKLYICNMLIDLVCFHAVFVQFEIE